MSDTLINQLPAIIFALAALVSAIGTVISVVRNGAKLHAMDTANQAKLDAIGVKVDGGITKLQDALASIALTATTQAAKEVVIKEGQRATDRPKS